jgi:hypothetical protein
MNEVRLVPVIYRRRHHIFHVPRLTLDATYTQQDATVDATGLGEGCKGAYWRNSTCCRFFIGLVIGGFLARLAPAFPEWTYTPFYWLFIAAIGLTGMVAATVASEYVERKISTGQW